jgi:predicted molibdopterin-dependent oxidoreductase YjgC
MPKSPDKGESRGPFCLMGVCFDCLTEIDGRPTMQSCLVTVREGMVIRRQPAVIAGKEGSDA